MGAAGNPCVVERDVEATVLFVDASEQPSNRCLFGDVHTLDAPVSSDRCDERERLVETLLIQRDAVDERTASGERTRSRTTDARSGARDEDDFALEIVRRHH
jgi:hypothetical protein